MRGTIRFRITAIATVAVFLVLAVAGIALVVALRRILIHNLEDTIRSESNRIARLARSDALTDPITASSDDLVVQVTRPDGTPVAATANLRAARAIGAVPTTIGTVRWRSVDRLPGTHDPFRVSSRRVTTPSGARIVHVAAALDDVQESRDSLARLLVVTVPIVTALLAAVVWRLVGRTLRPVEAIRSEVDMIGAADLSRRVPESGGTDEVAQLARTMNAMLTRVEDAAERQQRFVADASHELRGPLARMRSELEVDRDHPETADPEGTRESVLDEVEHLQRLVDDLLALARSDAGTRRLRRDPVDLDDLVLREVARLRAERDAVVDATAVSAAQVTGDRDALARLVRNLLDNAARHSAGAVTVSLGETDGEARFVVADDGPGIAPADRERVFRRFTRLDDARGDATGGTGLGLAIARDIATAHGGRIEIDDAPQGGARFVVSLPTAPGF